MGSANTNDSNFCEEALWMQEIMINKYDNGPPEYWNLRNGLSFDNPGGCLVGCGASPQLESHPQGGFVLGSKLGPLQNFASTVVSVQVRTPTF